MRLPGGHRPWGELSEVERVGLYTRQSLYLLLGGYTTYAVVLAAGKLDGGGQTVAFAVGAAAVCALGVATIRGVLDAAAPPRSLIAALLAAGTAYVLVGLAFWEPGAYGVAATVVVVAVALALGVLPGRRVAGAVVLGSTALLGLLSGTVAGAAAGLVAATAFLFTARVSAWLLGVVTELDGARHAQAELAVLEERLRFSRDVHDVLGRRLSTIAVQSELAATLAGKGDERASDRMLEVRGVAHEALREARELAHGYRSTDLPTELEGARSLLRSAGIEVRVDVADVPRAWHEAAGWVVRESVTNVLRHSRASTVEILYAEERLSVSNDGAAAAAGVGDGSGLRGLRERLAPLGASLDAEAGVGERWTVAARLPEAGPISAARSDP